MLLKNLFSSKKRGFTTYSLGYRSKCLDFIKELIYLVSPKPPLKNLKSLMRPTSLLLCLAFLSLFSFTSPSNDATTPLNNEIATAFIPEAGIVALYEDFKIKNTSIPQRESFYYALNGYEKLRAKGLIKNEMLTIVDFSLSSTKKRLWVLDMRTHKVVFHSIVAHGRNTGAEFAKYFSNTVDSNKSSLGFYVTGETYYGKNGLSLFLDGQERGINSNARKRYVVMHGARYVDPAFIKGNRGIPGRSLGCPSVPTKLTKPIINKIKGKSCLFIYHPNQNYKKRSVLIR